MTIEARETTHKTLVVNLTRRPDRRAQIEEQLQKQGITDVEFTSDWSVCIDGQALSDSSLIDNGYALFPWQMSASGNEWWDRPLKWGEIGCTIAHIECWKRARALDLNSCVVLEDDAVLASDFRRKLDEGLSWLSENEMCWHILYLGRYPLEPDREKVGTFAVPGYNHCSYGYVLSREGIHSLLEQRLDTAIVPVDEFLPAMYIAHPRDDVRKRYNPGLKAFAFDPPLCSQLPKETGGSDTEDSSFV